MFTQSRFSFLAATMLVAFGILATAARPAEPTVLKSKEQALVSGLTVTQTSTTAVALSWSAWLGAGDYRVTVLNLTTSQVEQQFTTSSTSAAVISLTTGNTYRFSVDKAGYIIAEDILM